MAPRERRNNSCSIAESKGSDAEEASCLQDLPLSAQSLVYKYLDGRARNALLCSSRWGMDLVLREVKAIRLILRDIDKAARRKPLLRLLGKALRSASAGLSVAVMSSKEVTIRGASAWIEEAARLPGWSSIKELMIEGPSEKRYLPAALQEEVKQQYLPAALPTCISATLQRLDLVFVSVAVTDLNHLAASSQISSLTFFCCQLPALPVGQNPLTALASLKMLTIKHSGGTSCVKGLTQLTSLHLGRSRQSVDEVLTSLAGCTQLQELELCFPNYEMGLEHVVGPQHIQQILAISSQLRSLELCHMIDQQQSDVLLTHGTQLTSLTCGALYLEEDRSMSACSLKSVTMTEGSHTVRFLANMPLHSLERLQFAEEEDYMNLPAQSPLLRAQAGRDSLLADRLRRALTNLERCPAWQQSGASATVYLCAPYEDMLPQSELSQVFQALSAVVSKSLHLSLHAPHLVIDAAAAQALGSAVGPRLTELSLDACQLHPSFWAAMWAHLPNLQQLVLERDASPVMPAASLVSHCLNATRPLKLKLSRKWRTELGGVEQAQQLLQAAGVTLVTVVKADSP